VDAENEAALGLTYLITGPERGRVRVRCSHAAVAELPVGVLTTIHLVVRPILEYRDEE
jgi:hypothetical protein